MNSLKNTIVAILLLGVSYGVYQVLTKPEPKSLSTAEFHALSEPEVEVPGTLLEPPPPADGDQASADSNEAARPAPPPFTAPPVEPPPANPSTRRPENLPMSESPATKPAPWSKPPVNKPLPASDQSAPPLFGTNAQMSPPAFGSSTAVPPVTGDRAVASGTSTLNGPAEPQLSAAPMVDLGTSASGRPLGSSGGSAANIPAQTGVGSIGLTAATAPLPSLDNSLQTARQLIAAGQMRQALAELSPQLQNPALTAQDQVTLYKWLDTLAGKVIYSTEHLVQNQPHLVQPNETLASLADAWRVPQQLVYNINREKITNQFELQPGTELKKIAGPFRAEINRESETVTLFLDELYAGRFKCVSLAADTPIGTFRVENKMESGHPAGQYLLQTDNVAMNLHAQPAAGAPSGCCFTQSDARDLFSILSLGSEIKVTR